MLQTFYCKECSHPIHTRAVLPSRCPGCGKIDPWDVEPQEIPWPKWARIVKRFRSPADEGVGDTVQRYAATVGGEVFKRVASRIGMPCGCSDRQKEWNRLYRYA